MKPPQSTGDGAALDGRARERREEIEFYVPEALLEDAEAQTPEGEDDEEGDFPFPTVVVRLDAHRFRVVEPSSLLGPFGPMLHVDDILHARAREDGTYRVFAIERAQVHSWTISGVHERVLKLPVVQELIARVTALDGGWEWCAGNLTVQIRPTHEDSEAMQAFLDALERAGREVPRIPLSEGM